MPASFQKRHLFIFTLSVIANLSLLAATPQEDAFMKVWSAHARAPQDHKAVIDVCQSVMDASLPHWENFFPSSKRLRPGTCSHQGTRLTPCVFFESALSADKAAKPMVRYADVMARRWLTRIDYAQTERALKAYYIDNVEYPSSLAPLLNLPKEKVPPKTDRFGDPWVYKTEEFSKLTGLKNQRFTLYSTSLGNKSTKFSAVPFEAYWP